MAKFAIDLSGYIEDSQRIFMDNSKMLRSTASGILLDPHAIVRVSAYQDISVWNIDLFAFNPLLKPAMWQCTDPFEGLPATEVKIEIAERVVDMYKRREIFLPLQCENARVSDAMYYQVVLARADIIRFCSKWCQDHPASVNEEEVKKIIINNDYGFWKKFSSIRTIELKRLITDKSEILVNKERPSLFKDDGADFLEWIRKRSK